MQTDVRDIIEAWFTEHEGDGDFVYQAVGGPYSVSVPTRPHAPVIYTTKPTTVWHAITSSDEPMDIGMVGRCGLPRRSDLPWISKVIGQRAVLFLGDMDPPELMIFAWLRATLRPIKCGYLGINDSLLSTVGIGDTRSLEISLSRSEVDSLAVLHDVFPDWPKIVGSKGERLLRNGRELELEGIMLDRERSRAALQTAMSWGKSQ